MQTPDTFRVVTLPDLREVSHFICQTWERPCWNYDVDLLTCHIMRPTGDPGLAIGHVTENGTLASFQAYMPFTVEYAGAEYRAVFASFLTVSAEYQRIGLARSQQAALIDLAVEKGYDLYITMCENGAPSNNAVKKVFKMKGLEAVPVKTFCYLAGINRVLQELLPATPSVRTRACVEADLGAIAPRLSAFGAGTDLRKRISEQDVAFLFLNRPHTKTYVYEVDGEIFGLINVLLLEVLDTEKTLNVYFDNVYFGTMGGPQQREFLGDVLALLQAEQFSAAFMPKIGYAPLEAFRYYRFRAAQRELNLYIAKLKPDMAHCEIRPLECFYLDVY
ncbi:MAG: hypothetical protein ACYCRH_12820 [Acidiferrobacteraceae bacterium]